MATGPANQSNVRAKAATLAMHAALVDELRVAYGQISWLVNSDPFRQTSHLRDRAHLQSLARDGVFLTAQGLFTLQSFTSRLQVW